MRRVRTQKSAVGVSLFPFLAVLICTMGALIVLLVLVVQLARVDASEETHETDLLTQPDVLQAEKEDYQWRRELLEQQRTEIRARTASKRLELSHLEQHIRELQQRWDALRQNAADLERRRNGDQVDLQGAEAELRQLQEAIDTAEKDLDAARQRAASQPPKYSIVPYDGPNGTHRRPIYLECTQAGVVLQPEGVLFPVADFLGPLGPGNPLDAALRAIREYYTRSATGASKGEPYPLLIVRPDGVDSYSAARAAMRAWDDEFGYELIDQSMELEFPEADPALRQLLNKTIADARSRQRILAAAMPSKFGSQGESGFVASPTRGGFVAQSGAGQEGAGRSGPGRSRAERQSRGHRTGGFGQGGDSRYIDGRAAGRVQGEAASVDQQTVGGAMEKGNAAGKQGAAAGTGCSPLANQRGRNWGLPGANASATGIIRPIRVALLADRLILLPDRDERRSPVVVLIDGGMADEMDEFVAKVWDRIEQWGIAVAGGYWKPVLRVHVAQGADQRFQELRVLLDGSGLEVQRSGQ